MKELKEYQELKSLQSLRAYQILQALWAQDAEKILKGIELASKSPSSGKDSSLRFWAGQWSGFNIAIGHLDRALAEMEKERNNDQSSNEIDKTLAEIRGLRKQGEKK